MLYSFDIDGTLIEEYISFQNFRVEPEVLQKLCTLILNGHTILFNTSNSCNVKPKLILSNILKYTFSKNEEQPLFDEQQQKQIVENINKNFYTCLCSGCNLIKNSVLSFDKLKDLKDKEFFDSGVILGENLYTKSIPKTELIKLRDLLETDAFFGKNLNIKKWGYVNPESKYFFPLEKVFIPYNKKLPEMARIVFARINNEDYRRHTGVLQDNNKQLAYLSKIIEDENIFVEPIHVSKNYLFFGPKNYTKATPIEYLQESLKTPANMCQHFGNKPVDILPESVAKSYLIDSPHLKTVQIPETTHLYSNVCLAINDAIQNTQTQVKSS